MRTAMQNTTPVHPIERFLAILAAVVCLVVTIAIWLSVGAHQPMWPLPALYFIEVAALGILSAFMFIRGGRIGRIFTWASAGIFLGFALMGAFSVGLLYLPITFIFAAISVSSSVGQKQLMMTGVAAFLIAGLAQTALMLVVIRLI
jgi:hypothetical protein